MSRPPCCRRIARSPAATLFKPCGMPARMLESVVLGIDELEAIRLADLEGLYQEEAAARMGVSRSTFGRVVEHARHTVARALVHGLVLRVEGGPVQLRPRDAVEGDETGGAPSRGHSCGGGRGRGRGCDRRHRAGRSRTEPEDHTKGEAQ